MNRTLFFAAVLSFNASAQDSLRAVPIADPGNSATVSRWQIGISFSPDMNYRTLSGEPSWIIGSRNDSESPLFGYTTGANAVFNFNGHLGIEAAIHFSEKGYRRKIAVTDSEAQVIGEAINKDLFDYLEIPLKVNYTIGKNKLRWTVSAGVINGLLVDARNVSKFEISGDGAQTHKLHTTSDFERYNLSAMLSAGIDWRIGSRMHLKAEPTFRYGLTQIIDAPVTANLWSVGLHTGLYFSL